MIRVLTLGAIAALLGVAMTFVLPQPWAILATVVLSFGLAVAWQIIWPEGPVVEYVDLTPMSEAANLPDGYVVRWIETDQRRDGSVVENRACILHTTSRKEFFGMGRTIEAAVAHAATRARMAGQ